MAAWLSVKMVHRPGLLVLTYISRIICSISISPLRSATYIVEVSEVPMYCSRFALISLLDSIGATVAAPTL